MRALILSLLFITSLPLQAGELAQRAEQMNANVIFMRHALAPGFGDPENFEVGRCETQRNLDAQGRQQARDLGVRLAAEGFQFSQILSSEWCRCYETADLLELGEWQTFSGLNSFFQGHAPREQTLSKLNQYLDSLSSDQMVLLVTHQVVISATTGISPPSGGLVLFNSSTGKAESWRW